MHGEAVVAPEFFDEVLPPTRPAAVRPATHDRFSCRTTGWALHASRLVADGGTLQIGIGSLSDALVHALILRQRDNERYRALLGACDMADAMPPPASAASGPFERVCTAPARCSWTVSCICTGPASCRREVFDDEALQAQSNAGERCRRPAAAPVRVMDGGFFLGSQRVLRVPAGAGRHERPRFRMQPVSRINQLYGGSERLEIAQRQGARFINSCMMVTLTGACGVRHAGRSPGRQRRGRPVQLRGDGARHGGRAQRADAAQHPRRGRGAVLEHRVGVSAHDLPGICATWWSPSTAWRTCAGARTRSASRRCSASVMRASRTN
jgi:hypothetical protein